MTTRDPFEGVPAPLRSAMERRGFTALTAVQSAVLDNQVVGRNLRISSQTGSGKTIAIGLALAEALSPQDVSGETARVEPSLQPDADVESAASTESIAGSGSGENSAENSVAKPDVDTKARDTANAKPARRKAARAGRKRPRALIIAPTRELAVQVQGELDWLFARLDDISVIVVTGGSDLRRERMALSRGPAIVVGTPGRMLDHIRTGALDTLDVEQVVLDEADRMLDMGFREELEAIVDGLPAERRSHLVSATFPSAVRRLADRFQKDPVHVQGNALGAANENIEHIAHLIRPSDRYAALVNTLLVAQGSRCLVFVERRTEAADVAERLAKDGFAALPFSGELAQAQRTRTLAAFRNGSVGTLVATDVAARGIDVPDIGVVIQMSLPTDADGYTHRSGRTGRAGQTGRSVLLVPASAEHRARRLLEGAGIKLDWRPVPGPEQIRKLSSKALRRTLHASLDAEEGPSAAQLEYATKLLEERDPVQVIARLMEMAEPPAAREPMAVAALTPGTGAARAARADRAKGERPAPRSKGGDFVPFVISWGKKSGASTPRLLSHICRRGGITARSVGAIRIGPESSRFGVASAVATSFERKAAKPDKRDPSVHITRDRNAAPPTGSRPNDARRPGSPRTPVRRPPRDKHAKRSPEAPTGRAGKGGAPAR